MPYEMTDGMIDEALRRSHVDCPEDWRDDVRERAREAGHAHPVDYVESLRRQAAERVPSPAPSGDLAAELARLRAVVEALARVSGPGALVTVAQAAEATGLSEKTIRRRVRDGSIPSRRIGRSVRVDLAGLRPLGDDEVARLAREARTGHA